MKPLNLGQQMFSWFYSDAFDKPLPKYQQLMRMALRCTFGAICTAIPIVANANLFGNQASRNNLNELFYGLFQLNVSLHEISAFIATLAMAHRIVALFQSLTNIYDTCKRTPMLYMNPIPGLRKWFFWVFWRNVLQFSFQFSRSRPPFDHNKWKMWTFLCDFSEIFNQMEHNSLCADQYDISIDCSAKIWISSYWCIAIVSSNSNCVSDNWWT